MPHIYWMYTCSLSIISKTYWWEISQHLFRHYFTSRFSLWYLLKADSFIAFMSFANVHYINLFFLFAFLTPVSFQRLHAGHSNFLSYYYFFSLFLKSHSLTFLTTDFIFLLPIFSISFGIFHDLHSVFHNFPRLCSYQSITLDGSLFFGHISLTTHDIFTYGIRYRECGHSNEYCLAIVTFSDLSIYF